MTEFGLVGTEPRLLLSVLTHGVLDLRDHPSKPHTICKGEGLQHCTQYPSLDGEENSDSREICPHWSDCYTTTLRLLEKVILEIGCRVNAI